MKIRELFPTKEKIPDGYRKQSEIDDWLPGASSISNEHGQTFCHDLYRRGNKRQYWFIYSGLALLFFLSIALTAWINLPELGSNIYHVIWGENDNINPDQVSFLEITKFFALVIVSSVLALISLNIFYHKGIATQSEPNYQIIYSAQPNDEFSKVMKYFEGLSSTSAFLPIYYAAGNNGWGKKLPSWVLLSEYSLLALIGNKKQRKGIFGFLLFGLEHEWWFPSPELLEKHIENQEILSQKPPNTRGSIRHSYMRDILDHTDKGQAKKLLILMSTEANRQKNHEAYFSYMLHSIEYENTDKTMPEMRKEYGHKIMYDIAFKRIMKRNRYRSLEEILPSYLKSAANKNNQLAQQILKKTPSQNI